MIPSKDFRYCPKCRQEICLKNCKCETITKKVTRCVNPLTGGYLDPYIYKDEEECYIHYCCPNDGTVIKIYQLY